MAEQISIPAGVNPNSAAPPDAIGRSTGAVPDAGLPAIPASGKQEPGFVPPAAAAPAGADAAEFAAFQAWKASQAQNPTPAVAPVVPKPAESKHTPGFESMGADNALSAAQTAAQSDPYLMSTFSMFEMVAPEVDLARALGNAIDRGDPSLIDRRYLAEKAGDKAAKLIQVAEGLVTHVTKTVETLTSNIYSKAGGEAQWDAAVAVFNNEAPKYLKEFVAQSIDSANPSRVESAVEALLDFTSKSGKLPVAPQGHIRAGGGAPNAAMGISKQEFQELRQKLNRNDRDFADKERELVARRQLGKSLGK